MSRNEREVSERGRAILSQALAMYGGYAQRQVLAREESVGARITEAERAATGRLVDQWMRTTRDAWYLADILAEAESIRVRVPLETLQAASPSTVLA